MTTDPRAQAIEKAANDLLDELANPNRPLAPFVDRLRTALALPPDHTTSELREADRLAVNIGILLRRRPGIELLIYDNDGENFGIRLLDLNVDGPAKCIARRISFDLPFVIDAFNQQLSAAAVKGAQQCLQQSSGKPSPSSAPSDTSTTAGGADLRQEKPCTSESRSDFPSESSATPKVKSDPSPAARGAGASDAPAIGISESMAPSMSSTDSPPTTPAYAAASAEREARPWKYTISVPNGNEKWPGRDTFEAVLLDTGHSDRVRVISSDELNCYVAALRQQLATAREALGFYAVESNYDYDETCCSTKRNKGDVLSDCGDIARKALAKMEAQR